MFFVLFVLLLIALIFINPSLFLSSSQNALNLFALKVLPVVFPFFFLTKILSSQKVLEGFRRKFPQVFVFALSVLCGYPMGAKLIAELYERGEIDKKKAEGLLSFCSTSSPVFVLGSIGAGFIFDLKLAWLILVSHIIGSLLNGILFNLKLKRASAASNCNYTANSKGVSVGEAVWDSIKSVLIVGGYIVLFNVLIDILHLNTLISGFIGLLEVSRGVYEVSQLFMGNKLWLGILLTGLVSFGGICVHFQSLHFLFKAKVSYAKFLLQKVLHSIISMIIIFILLQIIAV